MASHDIYGLGVQPSLNLQAQSHLHPSSYGTRFLRHQSPCDLRDMLKIASSRGHHGPYSRLPTLSHSNLSVSPAHSKSSMSKYT